MGTDKDQTQKKIGCTDTEFLNKISELDREADDAALRGSAILDGLSEDLKRFKKEHESRKLNRRKFRRETEVS